MTGSEIKQHREALGWSQRRLANEIGVTQPHICRIEAGETPSNPVLKLLEIWMASELPSSDAVDGEAA